MKILGNYFSVQVGKPAKNSKVKDVEKAGAAKQVQTDSITISASKAEVSSASFTSMLKTTLNERIREEKSEEQLNAIAEKIAEGNYKIDADGIAKKILLRG